MDGAYLSFYLYGYAYTSFQWPLAVVDIEFKDVLHLRFLNHFKQWS